MALDERNDGNGDVAVKLFERALATFAEEVSARPRRRHRARTRTPLTLRSPFPRSCPRLWRIRT